MKLTTASLILSGALAAWAANADNNKAPLLNDENIKPPVTLTQKDDVVTLYADATSLNIAEVVWEKKSVSYNAWCKENPEACKSLNEQKAKSEKIVDTKSATSNLWVIVKWKAVWLGFETQSVYVEATSNFDDELWAGAAYKFNSGAVAWVSYADKKDVGSQTWVWAWFVKSFDNSYVWAWLKYTDFNAKGIYADANSVKAQVMWAYEITSWLFAEASVWYKTFKADTFDNDSRVEWSLWLAYMTPDFTARIASTINQSSNQVMATLSFPIGGKNKVSAANLGQSSMARFIADSSFDNSIVKVKKVPVVTPEVPLPAQTLSITTSWPVVSWANSDNVTALIWPWGSVDFTLSVNSPYTLSNTSLSFPESSAWTYTQNVNILHNGNVVWTRTISVTWQL